MPEDDDPMVRCMACWWASNASHVAVCTADSVVSAYHTVRIRRLISCKPFFYGNVISMLSEVQDETEFVRLPAPPSQISLQRAQS